MVRASNYLTRLRRGDHTLERVSVGWQLHGPCVQLPTLLRRSDHTLERVSVESDFRAYTCRWRCQRCRVTSEPRVPRRWRSAGWAPATPAGRRPRTGGRRGVPARSLVTERALAAPMKHPVVASRSRVGRESALAGGRGRTGTDPTETAAAGRSPFVCRSAPAHRDAEAHPTETPKRTGHPRARAGRFAGPGSTHTGDRRAAWPAQRCPSRAGRRSARASRPGPRAGH
jgi:hypothetical protein